jgi:hypothetical protein
VVQEKKSLLVPGASIDRTVQTYQGKRRGGWQRTKLVVFRFVLTSLDTWPPQAVAYHLLLRDSGLKQGR